jgi:DNA-binding CsgD family transcriptional regulator
MEDFIKQDDNIKRHCLNESVPITYQDLLSPDNASERPSFTENIFDRNQFELIVPINGFGGEFACLLFSISKHAMQPNLLEKLGWYWLLLSAFIYSRYRKNIAQSQPKITKRELECIKWASEGKTSWEISQLLRISQRTVDFHLTNCIAKTNSINRQQAIVKCIFNGQLLAI